MPIIDEITRLQQAKQDFKEKLIEKGVTVGDELLISDYPPLLDEIQTGVDTSDATATSEDILLGKTAYVNDVKVVGTIEDYDGSYDGDVEEGLIIPTGTYQVTNNGEYDITEYAKVNVNVAGSGGSDTTQEDGLITRRQIEYSNDRVTLLSSYVFYHYDTIKKISFKNVITVGNYCFGSCNALIEINLPKVETIYNYGLVSCTKLKNLNFPNLTYCNEKVFRNCLSVESAYIPKITYMGTGCFEYCNLLKAVIITQEEQICTLNKDGFKQCYHMLGIVDSTYNPNGDKDGYIYVPDSLVDSYKSATNWSTYADQIKPLSELPQEYKNLYNIA